MALLRNMMFYRCFFVISWSSRTLAYRKALYAKSVKYTPARNLSIYRERKNDWLLLKVDHFRKTNIAWNPTMWDSVGGDNELWCKSKKKCWCNWYIFIVNVSDNIMMDFKNFKVFLHNWVRYALTFPQLRIVNMYQFGKPMCFRNWRKF